MKENRATLITILVLLGVFGSITLFGTLVKIKNKVELSNPNHEFKFNNNLYFYDEFDELIGTYECKSDDCGYVKTIINDDNYGIDYYKNGLLTELKIFNNEYAYIQDGEKIIKYIFASPNNSIVFSAFKNYNTNLKGDVVIFEKNHKWGILSLKSDMIFAFNYDFIGLKNDVQDGLLNTDKYIVEKDNKWYLINNQYNPISTEMDKSIKTYTDNYIICVDNTIYDYNGNEVLGLGFFAKIYVVNNYIIGITNSNNAIVYLNPQDQALGYISLEEYNNMEIKYNNNMIEFYDDNVLKQSIALNGNF